jgi:hypothetical protein
MRPANRATLQKSSLVVYDNLGGKQIVDLIFTKTGDNEWDDLDQSGQIRPTAFPILEAAPNLTSNSTRPRAGSKCRQRRT